MVVREDDDDDAYDDDDGFDLASGREKIGRKRRARMRTSVILTQPV